MRYYEQLSDLIGHTPLLRLTINRDDWLLLGKMESFNPGGSIKDRSALGLIRYAEAKGSLKPGMTLVESSSGNTAIALAMLAAERGYKFMAVVDEHALPEKVAKIRALGGAIQFCDTAHLPLGQVGVDVRRQLAKQLAAERADYLCLDQYDNPDNPEFYYHTLGEELLQDTGGEIDILIGPVGTGSSLCGAARRLKEHNPAIRVYGVEPEGSISFGKEGKVYHQSGPGFPPGAKIPDNIDHALIDRDFQVADSATFHTMRFLSRERGIFLGDSGGATLYQAMQIIRQSAPHPARPKVLVALLSDSGNSYLSHAYDDAWMRERDLFQPEIEAELTAFYAENCVKNTPHFHIGRKGEHITIFPGKPGLIIHP